MTSRHTSIALGTCVLLAMLSQVPAQVPSIDVPEPSVFERPIVAAQLARLQQSAVAMMRSGDYVAAEKLLRQAMERQPDEPVTYYNLACAMALQGNSASALENLKKAVERGFRDVRMMQEDEDLASLRDQTELLDLVEKAKLARRPVRPREITPQEPVDGQVTVAENNTLWDPGSGLFRVFFKASTVPVNRDGEVVLGHGKAGDLIRAWYAAGTAAGNVGDFYDNHDGDHSNLATKNLPQLTRIEFSEAARKRRLNSGLQDKFFYNVVTFGNSSTAVMGKFWRSQPRLAYTSPRGPLLLYAQYRSNQLYVYPEHRDYDPGHTKRDGDGYGDVYCANTPYLITSQGSSGSDRKFLDAIGCTLAAFRPDVKRRLIEHGALAPTLQMVFRRSYQPVVTDQDYLSGKAHPVVFNGKLLNVTAMVTLAHDIRSDDLPPLALIQIEKEDTPVAGVDYFDVDGPRERLFDTPAAVARIMRSTKYRRRFVVSAAPSKDINGRALTYHWRVLQGNEQEIEVTPLDDSSSVVELSIPYHARRPVQAGSDMESNRVDIGLFVHNGAYYSAPAILSFFFLDNETRVYNDQHQIERVTYASAANGGDYVDPAIDTPKNWIDEYHYDAGERLSGWTRRRGDDVEHFTTDGALVTKWDDQHRPAVARTVRYVADRKNGQVPVLRQELGDETLHYRYSSPTDRVGTIADRRSVTRED